MTKLTVHHHPSTTWKFLFVALALVGFGALFWNEFDGYGRYFSIACCILGMLILYDGLFKYQAVSSTFNWDDSSITVDWSLRSGPRRRSVYGAGDIKEIHWDDSSVSLFFDLNCAQYPLGQFDCIGSSSPKELALELGNTFKVPEPKILFRSASGG